MIIAARWTLPRHCKWVPEAIRLLKSARRGSTSQLAYETRHPAFLISSQVGRNYCAAQAAIDLLGIVFAADNRRAKCSSWRKAPL